MIPSLLEFRKKQPMMKILTNASGTAIVKGNFELNVKIPDTNEIVYDIFNLMIEIPSNFPKSLPTVREIGRKIPQLADFHMYTNGTFCLGTPIGLREKLTHVQTFDNFIRSCLEPYLCAVSRKLTKGGEFLFGETPHGVKGLFSDWRERLHLESDKQIIQALELLSMKPREANKKLCPCGCQCKLRDCSYKRFLNQYRKIASREWYRNHLKNDLKSIKE